MNLKSLRVLSAMAIVCGASSHAAFAADGVLTINGNVKASPCYIDNVFGAAGSVNLVQAGTLTNMAQAIVYVPDVTLTDMSAPGAVGGTTTVGLHFAGGASCANGTYKVTIQPKSYYPQDTTIAQNDLFSGNPGVASGVGVQALFVNGSGASATATPIDFNNNTPEPLGTATTTGTTFLQTYQFRLARPANSATTLQQGLVSTAFYVTIQ